MVPHLWAGENVGRTANAARGTTGDKSVDATAQREVGGEQKTEFTFVR